MKKHKCVLSIAGSDPSGGAGIQADIKSISACGCFATTAITAVVNENTQAVFGVHPIPADFVQGQINSVLSDIPADAIKIGMLHSTELILAVRESLLNFNMNNIVLDPVMIATSGDTLLLNDAIKTLKEELIPISRIITPNIPEAETLLGKRLDSIDDMPEMAKELSYNGKVSVLLKGGHLEQDNVKDILYNAETNKFSEFCNSRINTSNTHGTGCSLSSAIAAFLAHGNSIEKACERACEYIHNAINYGSQYKTGNGNGPIHHFFSWW